MRDLFVIPVYLMFWAFAIGDAFVGVLFYYFVSFGDLHTLAWGISREVPWAYIAAATTLFVWLCTSNTRNTRFVWNSTNVLVVLWIIWIQITTILALNPDAAMPLYEKYMKILVISLIFSMFYIDRKRIISVLAITVGSLAFYGAKGGIHGLAGSTAMLGPSSFADRNDFAFSCVIVLPFLWYFRGIVPAIWHRRAITGVAALTLFATLMTLSRGAFVGLLVLAVGIWWRADRKVLMFVAGAVLASGLYFVLPSSFFARMTTIEDYSQDMSAESRLSAWRHAMNVAWDRPLIGGGLGTFRPAVYQIYTRDAKPLEAHSVYFQALGDQGGVGLVLFLAMLFVAWRNARWIRRRTRDNPECKWAYELALTYEFALLGYASAGAFVSQAYCELFYVLIITIGMTRYVIETAPAGEAAGATRNEGVAALPKPQYG